MLNYFINFIIVFCSIIIFILPFFIWYWVGHKESLKTLGLNRYLENFFSSKQANWLVFSWAATEAVIWFVIPEFLLLLVIFMRVHNKRKMVIYDIAGTVAGTIAAIWLRLPEKYISSLPYIQDKMVEQAKIWFNDLGIFGLLYQPFSGVPYKVFTNLSWQYEFNIIVFLIVAIAVRIFRYIVVYGLFLALYPKLHKIVYRHYIPLFIVATAVFSVLLYKAYIAYS